MTWEPTKHAGFRRTGVAQEGSTRTLLPGQSVARIKRRAVVRIHPPVQRIKGSGKGKWRLAWNEPLGLPECPFVFRWIAETPLMSFRIHHWTGPDDDRAFHDHPWWFWTLVVSGGYTDRNPAGNDHLGRFSVRFRKAHHRHTVIPDDGGAWTILVTGPVSRSWGFWLNGKFRKANKYFLTYGHHPCN